MQINIPDDLVASELTDKIVNTVLASLDERLKLLNKSVELSPYSNKTEIKKVLAIGDDKLSNWISAGLKVQLWSEKDIRIERSELQRFLKENFEVKEVS